ncbi:MAG: carbohydrate-binding domain-containing protein, partial [Oscillospiraceae bacterium]
MKKNILQIIIITLLIISLSGCTLPQKNESNQSSSTTSVSSQAQNIVITEETTIDTSTIFSNRDMEIGYDENQCTKLTLSDETITINKEGNYILSGNIKDGSIIIDVDKSQKVQLILDGVNINSNSSAAIYVKQADKVFITLAPNSENTLSVSGEYVAIDENNIDSVIFSKSDLTLNGQGKLTVNAEYGHGIVSKDELTITSGNYIISSENHGISANDSIAIASGNFDISSQKDAIHCENSEDTSLGFIYIENATFKVNSLQDGISASGNIQIQNGDFDITTGGGSQNAIKVTNQQFNPGFEKPKGDKEFNKSQDKIPPKPNQNSNTETQKDMPIASATTTIKEQNSSDTTVSSKGIKANGNISIQNGQFVINSCDDSIHSNSNVDINGGVFNISAGDDGIHADTQVNINDGEIIILESYEGIEGQNINICGGNIDLTSSDDGLNAAGGADQSGIENKFGKDSFNADENCYINILGGTININASGDGIDSNGNLTVSGGNTTVYGPTNSGNGALDYNGEATITGGTFVAIGASGMAQNFTNSSTQGAILINTQTAQSANSTISIKDSSNNVLLD